MRRRVTYGLIALAMTLAVSALIWRLAWVAGTAEGARFVLSALSRYTPLTVAARTVEGRLLDRLQLGDVRLSLAPYEVTIGRLDWQWVPRHLLSGRITAEALTLEEVEILDNSADAPTDLTWPAVSALAETFDGRIGNLAVNGLAYRLRGGEPFRVAGLAAALDWHLGVLSLTALSAESPQGELAGEIRAGFRRPSLAFDLNVTPADPLAGMDGLGLTGKFLPGKAGAQLAGPFAIVGSAGKNKTLDLAGEALLTRKALLLRSLRLTLPGRRGELTGSGSVTPAVGPPVLDLSLSAGGVDLAPLIGPRTDLSGTLTLAGTPDAYQGTVTLANRSKGWQAVHLSGSYRGDGAGVTLSGLHGSLLGGTLRGSLALAWERGISLNAALRARELNPAMIDTSWEGVANFDLVGDLLWQGAEPLRGRVEGRFLESRLHGHTLTGEVRADFAGRDLNIARLVLSGRGFDIRASGNLQRRLDVTANVADLGRLLPGAAGELNAEGWFSLAEERIQGAVTGRGRSLVYHELRIASLKAAARLGESRAHPVNGAATLRGLGYGGYRVDSLILDGQGTLSDHRIHVLLRAADAELAVDLAGRYDRRAWEGTLTRLFGRDAVGPWKLEAPARLAVAADRIAVAPLKLAGEAGERFEAEGSVALSPSGEPADGAFSARWNGLNLARAAPWLPSELALSGRLAGHAAGKILAAGRADIEGALSLSGARAGWQRQGDAVSADLKTAEIKLGWTGFIRPAAGLPRTQRADGAARIAASGVVTLSGSPITLEKAGLDLEAGSGGVKASLDAALSGGGRISGSFASLAPLSALPETGEVKAEWSGIDLALLSPWLPPELGLAGRIQGRAAGRLLPGREVALAGEVLLPGGRAGWTSPEGQMNVDLKRVAASWQWQGEALRGEAAFVLADRGEGRGSFRLPIPARLPARTDPAGPLELSLNGRIQEDGLLGALFPGFVRESRGTVEGGLRIGGTLAEPKFSGSATLFGAGAYLPTAGVRIKNVRLALSLEKELIRVDSFHAESGPGHLEGSAQARLAGWRVADFKGSVKGERFQAVFLPELQILASPALTFEGTPDKLAVRGEVTLPEMLISGSPSRDLVLASPDVVVEGAARPAPKKALAMALDVRVRLVIGPRVLVNLEGIDAKLAGAIDLEFAGLDRITSRGEIRVERGRYSAYGVNLSIVRGRLFYAGGPINQPTLDLLALRDVGDVKAGVTAGGILAAPRVKLYAEPAMPDADILSYILFGHPMSNSSNREQAGMMAQAASVLLSKGQSVALQEQIKNRLGLSTLEIQSESADAAERAGYKAIPAAPAGVVTASQTNGLSQTMVTVGKYLTPQLYFSYGRSLFTGGNLFRLRYDLFKQWQIETQTGSESGVDLYYRIDFK